MDAVVVVVHGAVLKKNSSTQRCVPWCERTGRTILFKTAARTGRSLPAHAEGTQLNPLTSASLVCCVLVAIAEFATMAARLVISSHIAFQGNIIHEKELLAGACVTVHTSDLLMVHKSWRLLTTLCYYALGCPHAQLHCKTS
jgi:hypothetical protein